MNEYDSQVLSARYREMPEKELIEMLLEPESEYQAGIYPLLLEAARSRGWGAQKTEILGKASSLYHEIEQKIISQPLTPEQRKMFMLFPGIAFWYSVFASQKWEQRKKEALTCQLIGSRNYLLAILFLVAATLLLSNEPVSAHEMLLVLVLSFLAVSTTLSLFYQQRKHSKTCDN